jgi:hypothetical protein
MLGGNDLILSVHSNRFGVPPLGGKVDADRAAITQRQ